MPRRVATAIILAIAATVTGPVPAPPASAAPSTSMLVPVTPCRLADTRVGEQTRLAASTFRVQIEGRCGVPAGISAVALTLTAAGSTAAGFVTAYPAGTSLPATSNLNYAAGQVKANGAVIAVANGGVDVYAAGASTPVVVDVTGYFTPASTGTSGRFVPIAPVRSLDTRIAHGKVQSKGSVTAPLPASMPADAIAAAVNITITGTGGAGFLTAYAGGGRLVPGSSTLNADAAGQTRAASAIIPVNQYGLTVFSSLETHVIVDYLGYFTGSSAPASADGLFVPIAPTRLVDTRGTSVLGTGVPIYRDGGIEFTPTGNGSGAVLNITMTDTVQPGYVVGFPARTTKPGTSSLNSLGWESVSNLWVGAQSAYGINVVLATSASSHLVVDQFGYFTGPALAAAVGMQPPANTAPPLSLTTDPMPGCFSTTPKFDAVNQIWTAKPGTYQAVVGSSATGPKGYIAVVGDSLTWQSATQTAVALRGAGWGPICVDATISRTVEFGTVDIPDGLDAVARIRSTSPAWSARSAKWVVALGTNDVGFAKESAAKARQYITDQLNAIGPVSQKVAWVEVRTKRSPTWMNRESIWDAAVAAAGVQVVPWSTLFDRAWVGTDLVHLVSAGLTARASMIAAI